MLSEEGQGEHLNDLRICNWRTPSDLYTLLGEQFVSELGLTSPNDVVGFNMALGLTKEGWIPFEDHDGAERFQILSPVRLQPHGVYQINRRVQRSFREQQLKSAREPWGLSLGDEEIVWGDKVILTRNGKRDGYNGKLKQKVEENISRMVKSGLQDRASGQ